VHSDPEGAQKLLRNRSCRHSGRGLARACALENVAGIFVPVLEGTGEVGMARARRMDFLDFGVDGPGVHPLFPVRVVAVRDQHRDGAAKRAPVTHPGANLHRIGFDLHATAAPVTELTARHIAV
jgi:hypothetical protein